MAHPQSNPPPISSYQDYLQRSDIKPVQQEAPYGFTNNIPAAGTTLLHANSATQMLYTQSQGYLPLPTQVTSERSVTPSRTGFGQELTPSSRTVMHVTSGEQPVATRTFLGQQAPGLSRSPSANLLPAVITHMSPGPPNAQPGVPGSPSGSSSQPQPQALRLRSASRQDQPADLSNLSKEYSARNLVMGQQFLATQEFNFKALKEQNSSQQGIIIHPKPNGDFKNRDYSPLMKVFGEKNHEQSDGGISRPQYQNSAQAIHRPNFLAAEQSPINNGSHRTLMEQIAHAQPIVQPFNIPANPTSTPRTTQQIPVKPTYQPFIGLGNTAPVSLGHLRGLSTEKNPSEHQGSEASVAGRFLLNGGDSSIISS
jgi:hypothetical protein